MLQSFRENSGKWFVKVLFVAIILSFCLWGITDVIRHYNAAKPVAKVNGESVSFDEFSYLLQKETSRLQQISKGKLSSQHFKTMGLHTQVLDEMINKIALEQEIKRLNLEVDDHLVRDVIHGMPAFQQDGKFKKEYFHQLLQHNGLTEAAFVEDLRRNLLSQQLFLPLTHGPKLPTLYKEALYTVLTQQRVFTTVAIPADKINIKDKPSADDLLFFYNKMPALYTVPEYRRINVILIDLKKMLQKIPVSIDELKAEYDRRQSEWNESEKRSFRKLTYPTRALAEEALTALESGMLLTAVSRKVKGGLLEEKELVDRTQVPDSAAETLFSLQAGQTSGIVESTTDYSIYQVTHIKPASVKSFEEVENTLRDDSRTQKATDFLQEIKNKIEDALASGKKLSEVAKEHSLEILSLAPMDKDGKDADAKAQLDSFGKDGKRLILDQTFNQLKDSQESPILDVDAQTAVGVELVSTTPSSVKSFEQVKEQVAKDYIKEKQLEEALKLAQKITQEAKNLPDLARVATANGLTLATNNALSLMDFQNPNQKDEKIKAFRSAVDDALLQKAFQAPIEQCVYGDLPQKNGFMVMMVEKTLPCVKDTDKFENFSKALDQMHSKDIATLLVEGVRGERTITIYEDVLEHFAAHD